MLRAARSREEPFKPFGLRQQLTCHGPARQLVDERSDAGIREIENEDRSAQILS
ncbi:hypothetical protein [Bradyrhizobium forestalis]|uniref:hypothetical protein n=1 Tax=Bradyrhizobium forestalis TaxID=1419263 RepID=UPI0013046662|nr:hypothetical protein [Bradyrhizobium forestalis]